MAAGVWIPQGPAPTRFGQAENASPDNEVSGAVHAVAPHPSDPDTLYIGAANGGIWKTTNATAAVPTWTPLTDDQASLSIGALDFDPTDATHGTLVAGIGRFSSYQRRGGPRTGLLRTTDGGATWASIDGAGALVGKNIAGVAARGATIVVGVDFSDSNSCADLGVFRSTDGGASFEAPTTMPRGRVFDLAGDPTRVGTLYASVVFAKLCSNRTSGIYKSTDAGASWTLVSNGAMNDLVSDEEKTDNIEMSVGTSDNVYAGIVNSGKLAGLFRSGDGGATWVQMDTPVTNENGRLVGINPVEEDEEEPGGFGRTAFSIVADPTDAGVVYVGGDHQPFSEDEDGNFTNSIGARTPSGRLFRGDASLPAGRQWVHLTHSSILGAPDGGTASSSAPHADSRDMAFDARGDIIEVDDGGVWRRTSPRTNSGDWFSLNHTLQVAELHDVAYDTRSDVIIAGTQDNGTSIQSRPDEVAWYLAEGGDGGDVAVDDTSSPRSSTRYFSAQNLERFTRRVFDTANVQREISSPGLLVTGNGEAIAPRFSTPLALNSVDPRRLVLLGDNSIYESFDGGETLTEIGPGLGPHELSFFTPQSAIAAGGRRSGIDEPDALYVGSGKTIVVRTAGQLAPAGTYPGDTVLGVVLDPEDWMVAYVIDSTHLYRTEDAGGSWTDITGDLSGAGAGALRQLSYISGGSTDFLVVGTEGGVFVSRSRSAEPWRRLGSGLPNAPVWDLDYDPTDDVLIAATLGRGAWKLSHVRRDLAGTTFTTTTTTTTTTPTTTTTLAPTTSTTLPCSSARCTLDRAVQGPSCTGQAIPAKVTKRFDRAAMLIDRALASPAGRAKRVFKRARRVLRQAGTKATKASKGKHPKISAECAAALRNAAEEARALP